MKYAVTVIKMLVLVVLVLFSVFNLKAAEVTLIPGFVRQVPLFVLPLGGILFGFLFAALYFYVDKMKLNKEVKKLNNKLDETQDELKRMHNLPLVEDKEEE